MIGPLLPHGTLDHDGEYMVRPWPREVCRYGPFTAPFNVADDPAISLPPG
ncbi:hypothetical protein [Nocardiopsis listeri]|nr:hypothetical protein [Nocardiopsis listeri]